MSKFMRFKFTDSLNNVQYLCVDKESKRTSLCTNAGIPLSLEYATQEPMLFRFALEDSTNPLDVRNAVKKFCSLGMRKIQEI